MGKASSAKKVARAAGAGGSRTAGKRRPWNYYGAVFVVLLLGIAGTVLSRHDRNVSISSAGGNAPAVGGTPWHEAVAFDICGTFAPNVSTTKDPVGITTNGDGVIQIHPFVKSAAGHNATLGKFASSSGIKLDAAELQLPGGKLYHVGDKCGNDPGALFVKEYAYPGSTVGTIDKGAPNDVRLADGHLLTVAFVPASQKGAIPAPPQAVQTALTSDMASSSTQTPPSAVPGVTTVTVPGSPAASTPAGSTPAASTPPSSTPVTSTPAASEPATSAPPTTAKK